MLGQMMLRRFRAAELIEVSEVIFASGIDRLEVDRLIGRRSNLATRENVDRKIYGHSAGMKQIEWPQIECAARQIHPAGSMSNDGVVSCCLR